MFPRVAPFVLAISLAACGGGSGSGREGGGADDGVLTAADDGTGSDDAGTDGAAASADDGADGDSTAADADVVEIRIEPADVVLDIVDGALPEPVVFTAIGTTAQGGE